MLEFEYIVRPASTFKKNHDIRGIWYDTKKKIQEFGFGYGHEEVEFNKMIKNLEAYLDEVSEKMMNDDVNKAYHNIDFSRYPVNKKYEYHFYLQTYDNVVVDLENFIKVFEDISSCMDRLAGYYYGLVCRKLARLEWIFADREKGKMRKNKHGRIL